MRKFLAVAALTVAGFFPLVVPAASAATKPLPLLLCTVSVSNQHPADYTTIDETVHVGAAGIGAVVTNHYSTKITVHSVASAGPRAAGARLPYPAETAFDIYAARPGYKVAVTAVVSWKGWRSGSCTSWFLPHAATK